MINLLETFGTDTPPDTSEEIQLGDLRLCLRNGSVSRLYLRDQELIRNIAFIVRDRDWGTLAPQLIEKHRCVDANGLRMEFDALYQNGSARLKTKLILQLRPNELLFSAQGEACGDFETNRSGFSLLHSAHLAGTPTQVEHSNGQVTQTRFPALIDPWRPFMDICAISHETTELYIRTDLHGDTFEMEDQRQWGDASYKTYNRSLDLPWPYRINDGETLEQSVHMTWQAKNHVALAEAARSTLITTPRFPEMALLVTPADCDELVRNLQPLNSVRPSRLLCQIDATLGELSTQVNAFARLQQAAPDYTFDFELVMPFDDSPTAELTQLAQLMRQAKCHAASVLVCPSVDRQSTPPGSDWPPCPPLEEIQSAAARAFDGITLGGGVVSFFPELNRKRPPLERVDFISHSLCPIVHAADDDSVMETLENIQYITATAQSFIADREYRIGPCSIAMRQNPYGSRTIDNPKLARVPMTDDDPRHRGDFGAAYAIGLATALALSGISVWAPASVLGPRGVDADWPITEVLQALASLAQQEVKLATIEQGFARLEVGNHTFQANLRSYPQNGLVAYGWTL